MKALIVYYSLTGKTELIAKAMGEVLGAELRKVDELGKTGVFGRVTGVINAIRGVCSKIKPMNFNTDGYDMIFIGTPVWAFGPTPAIDTFISKADFKDKKVVLFVTMSIIGGKRAIKIMKDAIESKGGEIVGSFLIRTCGMRDKSIINKGIEIAKQYRV